MRHVPSSVLRRLVDEPFAVPDAARQHLATCGRCGTSSGEIAENAARAFRLIAVPQMIPDSVIPDPGLAWARLLHQLAGPAAVPRPAVRIPRHPARRLVNAAIGSGAALAIGILAVGAGAAATLTTVFAPTRVALVPVNGNDLRAIRSILGIGSAQLSGRPAAAGSQQLPFGTLRWTSAGHTRHVASIAQARAATQLAYSPPASLPAGVGSPSVIVVQPAMTATVGFSRSGSSAMAGSSLVVTTGPAMLVQYRSPAGNTPLPTLGILTMRRPVASSTGASTSQLEAFLLSRPGVPADLAQEVRLLGNLSTILPVPVPPGMAAERIRVSGSPGVLLSAASSGASGVIWESRDGIVHVVAGLLDRKDILDVARQVG